MSGVAIPHRRSHIYNVVGFRGNTNIALKLCNTDCDVASLVLRSVIIDFIKGFVGDSAFTLH